MNEVLGLSEQGIKGKVAFWMILMSFVLPLCSAAFSIYWLILLADSIWLKSVGSSLFIATFFLLLLSLSSFAFNILSILQIKIIYEKMAYQLYIVLTTVSLVLCCICLSLSSYSSADRAYQEITDYCVRNNNQNNVISFLSKYSTQYSKKRYILRKTVDANAVLAGIFGAWLASFAILFTALFMIKDIDDKQYLLSKQQNGHGYDQQEDENQSSHEMLSDHQNQNDFTFDSANQENISQNESSGAA
ncbi:hypothetical protein TRFO_04737 [Tritrichomonas foetus]|uniref:Transmembrane protein n=1 Tax=Tritrichomonas foetus TaxID=1144522 RepID=A0A1J4KB88_9EUKA|nr:hypothetical protein TRFO_04737 [Tritrichomonas foetus]|eukprot:OHT08679.1 hypothetical protein TRFO_04737 [Tritrichomonas foetus]